MVVAKILATLAFGLLMPQVSNAKQFDLEFEHHSISVETKTGNVEITSTDERNFTIKTDEATGVRIEQEWNRGTGKVDLLSLGTSGLPPATFSGAFVQGPGIHTTAMDFTLGFAADDAVIRVPLTGTFSGSFAGSSNNVVDLADFSFTAAGDSFTVQITRDPTTGASLAVPAIANIGNFTISSDPSVPVSGSIVFSDFQPGQISGLFTASLGLVLDAPNLKYLQNPGDPFGPLPFTETLRGTFTIQEVPEPSTCLLMGLGLAGMILWKNRNPSGWARAASLNQGNSELVGKWPN